MTGLAILCSGQAGQRCDMLDDILGAADCSAACAAATRVLGRDVAAWWAGLDADGLFVNANAQFAIALYQIAVWERLAPGLPRPLRVAGYSLGELLAWHVAGALDAEETLRLVRVRAELMDRHAPRTDAAMAPAGAGCDSPRGGKSPHDERCGTAPRTGQTGSPQPGDHGCLVLWRSGRAPALRAARDRAMSECGLAVAIHRPGGELVLGGPAAAVSRFVSLPEISHPELKRLPVTVPSHTPWLEGAVAPFAAVLEASALRDPLVPVLAGIDAAPLRHRAEGIDALSRQLARPIRWDWCVDALAEAGVDVVLELGPGKDLAQMANVASGVEARSADEFGSADAVRAWVAARC